MKNNIYSQCNKTYCGQFCNKLLASTAKNTSMNLYSCYSLPFYRQ